MHRRSGFTLVELAIVLVVIGLIVGGVLVGTDLVRTAEARKLMRQMEEINSAVQTFRLKYNCLPGDCATATNSGLGTNGNGDGLLGATSMAAMTGTYGGCLCDNTVCLTSSTSTTQVPFSNRLRGEAQRFWMHLSAASLIPGTIEDMPTNNTAIPVSDMDRYFLKDAIGCGLL